MRLVRLFASCAVLLGVLTGCGTADPEPHLKVTINGQVLQTKRVHASYTGNLFYGQGPLGGIVAYFGDDTDMYTVPTLVIDFFDDVPGPGTYPIVSPDDSLTVPDAAYADYTPKGHLESAFRSVSDPRGEVVFTEVDDEHATGTFRFVGKNQAGELVEVLDGEFVATKEKTQSADD
jgi:hypothetical protein